MTRKIQLQGDVTVIIEPTRARQWAVFKAVSYREFLWSPHGLQSIQTLETHALELFLWLSFHRYVSCRAFISSHKITILKQKTEIKPSSELTTSHPAACCLPAVWGAGARPRAFGGEACERPDRLAPLPPRRELKQHWTVSSFLQCFMLFYD